MPSDHTPCERRRAVTIPNAGFQTSLSTRSISRLIAAKQLDVVRCGRAVRVTQESIDRFIEKGGTQG